MRMRGIVLLGVGLVAGCALPERDNIFDPANAPSVHAPDHRLWSRARLRRGHGRAIDQHSIVITAPRGHCLAIDARDTVDPQGTALTKIDFKFALVSADGEEVPIAPSTVTRGLGLLDVAIRNALPVDGVSASEFRVRAIDPGGSTGRATTFLVATNAPPTAAMVPARREVPLHGHPWIGTDAPVDVRFSSAISVDPDGDLLSTTWFVDGEPAPTSGTILDRSIETDASRRFVATFVVRDPSVTSLPAVGVVTVAPPRPWVFAGRDDYSFQRVETQRRTQLPHSDHRGRRVQRRADPSASARGVRESVGRTSGVRITIRPCSAFFLLSFWWRQGARPAIVADAQGPTRRRRSPCSPRRRRRSIAGW